MAETRPPNRLIYALPLVLKDNPLQSLIPSNLSVKLCLAVVSNNLNPSISPSDVQYAVAIDVPMRSLMLCFNLAVQKVSSRPLHPPPRLPWDSSSSSSQLGGGLTS
ncbi:unnamed protein product [Dovyalis caffra]|uniref:Uncharacterized protein n=1 Tax=Dovyalis caffra TaxID=77055 RepID=A0AAV1RNB5_9ROSI|nr:unnamed protein product [Dovyalis caffra]